LFGLGLAFIGIFLTSGPEIVEAFSGRMWLLVPGVILLLVGLILTLEGAVGRDRLWGMVVPLIPSAVAIWYLIEWRRNVNSTGHDPDSTTG
jgi:membrane protein implicated in regulation of membrane protease activity